MKTSEKVIAVIGALATIILLWMFWESQVVLFFFMAILIGILTYTVVLFDMDKLWERRFKKYHNTKKGTKWDLSDFHSGRGRH